MLFSAGWTSISGPRLPLLGLVLVLSLTTCTDAPPLPSEGEGPTGGRLAIGAQFSFAEAASQEQNEALNAAFDLVNQFRLVLIRVSTGALALDTVITVTPGQDQFDLAVDVQLSAPEESFTVHLTALQDGTVLFEAASFQARASTTGTGGSTPYPVTLSYAGPGFEAVSVELQPKGVVLAPGGTVQLVAEVLGSGGSAVQGVPMVWSSGTPAVGSVSGSGTVTGVTSGVTLITVGTPTGLEASVWAYIVSGEIAYVQNGHLFQGTLQGNGEDVTPGAANATAPAWSLDGGSLFYEDGGIVFEVGTGVGLVPGSSPAVSPDGTKLAAEVGGEIQFSNDDGTYPTGGPTGTAPQWAMDGETLIVGGGSIHTVRADGAQRTILVSDPGAGLPALSHPSGRIAYLVDSDGDGRGALFASGSTGEGQSLLIPEATGPRARPSWSPGEEWILAGVGGGEGVYLVPAGGEAPGILVPGLEGATEAIWRPTGGLMSPPSLFLSSMSPEMPGPGETVEILGGGFDWIIPENNSVLFPGPEGTVEGDLLAVEEDRLTVRVPDAVMAGTLRVTSRTREASLAFSPAPGKLTILIEKPPENPMEGVEVALSLNGTPVFTGSTDTEGQIVLEEMDEGEYEVLVTVPLGFSVEGENPTTVTLAAGASASIHIRLLPEIWLARFDPEVPNVLVAIPTVAQLELFDSQEDPISVEEHEIVFSSGSAHLSAEGTGGEVQLLGIYPCTVVMCATIKANVDNTYHTFPATVTSRISGHVTNASSEPLGNIRIDMSPSGTVGFVRTDPSGSYTFDGLLGGSYTLTPTAPDGFVSNPVYQTLTLDMGTPVGVADFQIVEQGAEFAGDLLVDGPAGLAEFASNGWGVVTGDLTISGTTLTNLDGMGTLQEIGGDLIFQSDLSSLANVNGLAALQSVGGNLTGNSVFAGLALNLPALTTVGGYFYFTESSFSGINLPSLTQVLDHFELVSNTITGPVVVGPSNLFTSTNGIYLLGNSGGFSVSIPGLRDPGPSLEVQNNPGVTSFTATQGTSGVMADVDIDIWNNSALTSISFPNMAQIREMEIYDHPLIQTINFPVLQRSTTSSIHMLRNGTGGTPLTLNFPLLQSVGTNFEVGGDGGDIGALSFPSMTTIPLTLWVTNSTGLTSISFPNLTFANFVDIRQNQDLTNFYVPSLTMVGTDMEVNNNPVLVDFDAGSLQTVGTDLIIEGNGALTDFDLSSFQGPHLSIWHNGGLISLPPIPSLASNAILYLDSNLNLQDLDGLAGVTQFDNLIMYVHPALVDLSGLVNLNRAMQIHIDDVDALTAVSLPSLLQVSMYLEIGGPGGAASLTSVSAPVLANIPTIKLENAPLLTTAAFPALTTLTDELFIVNTGLTSLNGFSSLTSAVTEVDIRSNAALLMVEGLGGIGDAASSDPIVTGTLSIQMHPNLCQDLVDDLFSLLESKFPGSAFTNPPVNVYNEGSCAGPSPGRGSSGGGSPEGLDLSIGETPPGPLGGPEVEAAEPERRKE